MSKWKIYYGDGSILEGEGQPNKIPSRDIQVIVQDHPTVGVELVAGGDYYVFDNGRWRSTDQFGFYDFLLDCGLVLFGRTIRKDEYREILKSAIKDKEGWLPHEVRI